MVTLLNLLKKEYVFVFLAILSFVVHFAFLSYPAEVVFDEYYYGRFSNAYLNNEHYFDIHPPLGKLMLAGFTSLSSNTNVDFDFEYIGKGAPPKLFFALRFLPALFGSFFILLFSWFAYLITGSRKTALVAGFFVLFDNAFLVQSKFAFVDIFLLFFSTLALCFFFLCQRQKSFGKKRFVFLVLTAISFGLAVSIKWTGLAVIGVIGFILVSKIFSKEFANYLCKTNCLEPEHQATRNKKIKEAFLSLLLILTIGLITYAIPFAVHFNLLTEVDKDVEASQSTNSATFQFPKKFIKLNKKMFMAATIESPVPDLNSSKWFQWPLQQKSIGYWRSGLNKQLDKNPLLDNKAKIFLFGNPAVWSLAIIFVIITTLFLLDIFLIHKQKRKHKYAPVFSILVFGYFANLLPFIFIGRSTYLYHHLPALTFAILLAAIWLTTLVSSKKVLTFTLISIVLGFFLIAPFTYGFPSPVHDILKGLQDYFAVSRGI